jgi:hypothetical protein
MYQGHDHHIIKSSQSAMGIPVTTVWRVLGLRMEDTAFMYEYGE